MLNVGLTGGIASGKSTVAGMFQEKGAHLIDFDTLAHFAQEPDRPAWRMIVETFGTDILNEDRTINRPRLGALVFGNPERLSKLNSIVHPAVFREGGLRIAEIKKNDPWAIVLSDIPLLIEVDARWFVDLVVLVYISPAQQVRRLMLRNGFSRDEALVRLASQMPIDDKVRHADIIINNEGAEDKTREIIEAVWVDLLKRERAQRLSSTARSG
jgi:dephospho-CoA kinase